jgi:AcrR family transcriptional regulator
VVFILEEESDPGRFSIHRLVHYCVDLAELLRMDRVVPVVIFLKPGSYRQELVLATAQMTYLSFRYLVCDLERLAVDDYLQSRNVVARVLLPLMQYAPERRVEVLLRALEGLAHYESDPEKRLKYTDFITGYADLNETEQAEYQRLLAQSTYREAIMGPIQKAIQESRQQGIQQGIQQGRQEGLQAGLHEGLLEAIQLALEIKFGEAGSALMAEIQPIEDLGLLRTIKEALRTAGHLEEIRLLYRESPTH